MLIPHIPQSTPGHGPARPTLQTVCAAGCLRLVHMMPVATQTKDREQAQKYRSQGSFYGQPLPVKKKKKEGENYSVLTQTAKGDKGTKDSRSDNKNYKLIIKI